jgi:RCC1 and BTB domain-containing protein
VACSYYHTICVAEDDELFGFGRNDYGQLGLGDNTDKDSPQPIQLLRGKPVLSVACGQYHTAVSLATGGIFTFGKNDYGQLGIGDDDLGESSDMMKRRPVRVSSPLWEAVVTQLSCGYYHTVGLTAEGKVYSW